MTLNIPATRHGNGLLAAVHDRSNGLADVCRQNLPTVIAVQRYANISDPSSHTLNDQQVDLLSAPPTQVGRYAQDGLCSVVKCVATRAMDF